MRRSTERTLLVLLLLVTGVYAVAEEVTLTTYYPSPRGVYNQLRTMAETLLAQTSGAVGIGIAAPATPHATSKLEVHGNTNAVVPAAAAGEGFYLYRDSVLDTNLAASIQLDGGTSSIGTFYPGTGDPAVSLTADAAGANIQMCNSADTAVANCTGGGDMTFNLSQTGGIDTLGKVLIGAVAPATRPNAPLSLVTDVLGNGIALYGRNIFGVPRLPPTAPVLLIDSPIGGAFNYTRIWVPKVGAATSHTLGLMPGGGTVAVGSISSPDTSIMNVYGELWDYDPDSASLKGAATLRNGDLQIFDRRTTPRVLRAGILMNDSNAALSINYKSGHALGGFVADDNVGQFLVCPDIGSDNTCNGGAAALVSIDGPTGTARFKGPVQIYDTSTGSLPTDGHVLTADAGGNATWQPPSGGGGMYYITNSLLATSMGGLPTPIVARCNSGAGTLVFGVCQASGHAILSGVNPGGTLVGSPLPGPGEGWRCEAYVFGGVQGGMQAYALCK